LLIPPESDVRDCASRLRLLVAILRFNALVAAR